MQEDLISFETAKLAKEKGFKTHTVTTGYTFTYLLGGKNIMINDTCVYLFLCEIQKWLREVHNIFVFVDKTRTGGTFQFSIHERLKNENSVYEFRWNVLKNSKEYNTYEEALEAGLQEALKLINN